MILPRKKSTEQDWLKVVKRIFEIASRREPPIIYRSELESPLIAFRALSKIPFEKPLSPTGVKTMEMLEKYVQLLKSKNKKFINIKNIEKNEK